MLIFAPGVPSAGWPTRHLLPAGALGRLAQPADETLTHAPGAQSALVAALTADPEAPTRTGAAAGLGAIGAYSAQHCKAAVEAGEQRRDLHVPHRLCCTPTDAQPEGLHCLLIAAHHHQRAGVAGAGSRIVAPAHMVHCPCAGPSSCPAQAPSCPEARSFPAAGAMPALITPAGNPEADPDLSLACRNSLKQLVPLLNDAAELDALLRWCAHPLPSGLWAAAGQPLPQGSGWCRGLPALEQEGAPTLLLLLCVASNVMCAMPVHHFCVCLPGLEPPCVGHHLHRCCPQSDTAPLHAGPCRRACCSWCCASCMPAWAGATPRPSRRASRRPGACSSSSSWASRATGAWASWWPPSTICSLSRSAPSLSLPSSQRLSQAPGALCASVGRD